MGPIGSWVDCEFYAMRILVWRKIFFSSLTALNRVFPEQLPNSPMHTTLSWIVAGLLGVADGIITWVVVGLLAGVLGKLIMPGKDPGGCFVTMLLGIAGAVVGGFLASLIGWGEIGQFDLKGLLIAIVGAMLLLFVYRLVLKKKGGKAE